MVTEEVEYLLSVNVEQANTDIKRLVALTSQLASIIRRLSGDENLDKAMAKIQQTIAVIQTARTTINLFLAASGPIGWATAIISTVSFGLAAADLVDYDSRGF